MTTEDIKRDTDSTSMKIVKGEHMKMTGKVPRITKIVMVITIAMTKNQEINILEGTNHITIVTDIVIVMETVVGRIIIVMTSTKVTNQKTEAVQNKSIDDGNQKK